MGIGTAQAGVAEMIVAMIDGILVTIPPGGVILRTAQAGVAEVTEIVAMIDGILVTAEVESMVVTAKGLTADMESMVVTRL